MEKRSIQLKHTLIYGSITGSIIFLILLLSYFLSLANNQKVVFLLLTVYTAGGLISVKRFRDRHQDGILSYGKAYGTAFLTFMTAGFIWAIYGYLLYKYFSPDLLELRMQESQDLMLMLGMPEDKIEQIPTETTAFSMAYGYLANSAIGGALLSLIVAAIYKRKLNPLITNE